LAVGFGQIAKFGGSLSGLVYVAAIAALLFVLVRTKCFDKISLEQKSTIWLCFLGAFIIAAFVTLYPISHTGLVGQGSDRDDALNRSIAAIVRGEYPYYQRTYQHHKITPLPGAMLLASPFYLMGGSAYQNLFWMPALLIFVSRFFGKGRVAVVFVAAFVAFQPALMQDVVVGGDYVANIVYVTISAFAAFRLLSSSDVAMKRIILSAIFLGIAVASRPSYFVVLPVLFFHGIGSRVAGRAAVLCGIAVTVAAALILPFYFYDPAGFSPTHIGTFARRIPYGTVILPALSFAIACSAAMIRLDDRRFFGLLALAMCPIFLPVLVLAPNARTMGYSVVITLWGGLWLFAHWTHPRPARGHQIFSRWKIARGR
jgi:hypothetical protein